MTQASPERAALAARIQLFAGILVLANIAVLGVQALTAARADFLIGLGLVGFNLALLALAYALRRTRYAAAMVVAYLVLLTLALASAGPLSGSVDGSAWILFQIPPLIATIVINQRRVTLGLAAFAAAVLTAVAASQLTGLINVRIDAPVPALWSGLGFQLTALGFSGLAIYLMEARASAALAEARASARRVEQQHSRARDLLGQQARLAAELQQRLGDIQERDAALESEASAQQALRAALSALAAPVIPVLAGVVVMPLIGDIDAQRGARLTGALLAGITTHQARVAVIDVTGVPAMDRAMAAALLRAARACGLLGATPILVGVSPEAAQTLASLDVDLGGLRTSADLQAGVAAAMGLLARRHRG